MNKQEAIERIKNIGTLNIHDKVAGQLVELVIKNEVLDIISQIDEPVEQEKLYTVEIPDPNSYCNYRYLSRNDNGICIDASNDKKWKQKKRNQFTESEIKQDFEWAWQWAKEVE